MVLMMIEKWMLFHVVTFPRGDSQKNKVGMGRHGMLRIRAMHEAKNSKICNFWTFWPVIQLINLPKQLLWGTSLAPLFFWVDLSTKISRSAVFASCIARILNVRKKNMAIAWPWPGIKEIGLYKELHFRRTITLLIINICNKYTLHDTSQRQHKIIRFIAALRQTCDSRLFSIRQMQSGPPLRQATLYCSLFKLLNI